MRGRIQAVHLPNGHQPELDDLVGRRCGAIENQAIGHVHPAIVEPPRDQKQNVNGGRRGQQMAGGVGKKTERARVPGSTHGARDRHDDRDREHDEEDVEEGE